MREALRHGDKTTAGGVLISSVDGVSHHGVRLAAEGDHATCPACKAGGPVINDVFPHFALADGRQLLVRGARVMCECESKPFVIPSQHDFAIEIHSAGVAAGARGCAQPDMDAGQPVRWARIHPRWFRMRFGTGDAAAGSPGLRARRSDGFS